MSFRTKTLLSITLTVAIAVAAVAWAVSAMTTRSYDERERRRTAMLLRELRRELEERSADVVRRVESAARSPEVARVASDPDPSQYFDVASSMAQQHSLDFLEVLGPDSTIISSAQFPARFGYKDETAERGARVFFRKEDLPDGAQLGLLAARPVGGGDGRFSILGGLRVDQQFVSALVLPEGMQAWLVRTTDPGMMTQDLATNPHFVDLVHAVQSSKTEQTRTIADDTVTALPLLGHGDSLPAVLVVTSSRRELADLKSFIHRTAFLVGFAGVIVGIGLSFWAAGRVTKPVRQLASTVRQVAGGDWTARAPVESRDDIGQLAADFNRMTEQLIETREHMLQAERVAAWRELARRLAHELKNPLFPLQITIENLKRARTAPPEMFDEVFQESTTTLLAEVDNLKKIIGRFSDFARKPAPQLEAVQLNDIVHKVVRAFDAQLKAPERPHIQADVQTAEGLPPVSADPEQIERVLRNLVLNALDAMPNGGTLGVRTSWQEDKVELRVSDTGVGLTPEECERLFTPYYTTKQHGTGLGLAIVQSVVSDHGAAIGVKSVPGQGATFKIEFRALAV
jgi:two-component system nitrogen regulation sensor histidine kinase NtrY